MNTDKLWILNFEFEGEFLFEPIAPTKKAVEHWLYIHREHNIEIISIIRYSLDRTGLYHYEGEFTLEQILTRP